MAGLHELEMFESTEDTSIACDEGVFATEFVLKRDHSVGEERVWGDVDKEKKVYEEITKILQRSQKCSYPIYDDDHEDNIIAYNPKFSSCGVHIHISSADPVYTVTESPMFGPFVMHKWAEEWQQFMIDKYDLRTGEPGKHDNDFCERNQPLKLDDSPGLQRTFSRKYLMLNCYLSFRENYWHFECRGMQDLFLYTDESVEHTERVTMVKNYIHDLCTFLKECIDTYKIYKSNMMQVVTNKCEGEKCIRALKILETKKMLEYIPVGVFYGQQTREI